ncbi:DUF4038 domain-containing protein [Saccharomonospora sp. NPDC046836]|uniref:apiosidase-like domain-containing protein n=1 Tax=Saccharomonospora sp. NPDC046836 TaxID=3156921 RepID=UPI0033C67F12
MAKTPSPTGSNRIRCIEAGSAAEVAVDEVVDLELGERTVGTNPFDTDLRTTLYGPDDSVISVPAFYDPRRGHVTRVSLPASGSWLVEAPAGPDVTTDSTPWKLTASNRAHDRSHGALSVDPQHPRHFRYADGTRIFPLGYEVDWLFMIDQLDDTLARVRQFLDSITGTGFNLVTTNVYAHSFRRYVPLDLEGDPRWIVPALAPWVGGNDEPNYASLNPAFFDHMDAVMLELHHRGVIVHLMIHTYNKDVNWPELASSDDDRYWHYIVARYQAFPNVLWDTAKESWYQEAEYIWSRIGLIRGHDGYRRLITVHDANPELQLEPSSRWALELHSTKKNFTDALVDVISDQVHETDCHDDAVSRYRRFARPYINVEFGYESGIDDLPSDNPSHDQDWQEVTRRAWQIIMGGGYPNYYYRNTAWSLFIPFPEPPGYRAFAALADFWSDVPYWRLHPADHLLRADGKVYLRTDRSREYVVYSEHGATFELDLPDGMFTGTWFDPYTGERSAAEIAVGPGPTVFEPERQSATVLRLRA